MERRNAWLSYTEAEEKKLEQVAKAYRNFLNVGKTERECVTQIIREARAAGYESLEEKTAKGEKLKAGDKVYTVGMKKIIALFHIGQDDISEGMNILGAHIDSPRLDVKQNPLYEDTDLAYLDTHYYGGVKKYQWVTLPLAIHGVVVKKDGSTAEVNIGEDEDDPIVYITDLLIHLAGKQMQKKAAEVIEGENLDILIGSRPLKDLEDDKKKEAVKQNVLNILKEKYDMEEEDFLSAELEIVPAGKARECGLDRSMIAAYGQDDRVCAYTSLLAMLGMDTPKHTSCCLFTDKEEIGSVGATGMQSRFFENAVAELLDAMGCYSDLRLRRTLKNSSMLSSDVSAGYDPAYGEAFEKKNAAYLGRGIVLNKFTGARGKSGSNDANAEYVALGRGIVLNKFTGARGKSGSNDANAEYVARVRNIFDSHEVAFQTAELGKVDIGGGGTIAYIAALYGMEVIDSGVAVLSMHAPWEVTSKADIYEAKKAYKAFLLEA
ncbi:aminopeptidase [Blautia wexlerae]|uniref:aminopeptidase n=1 Tax=Blautia wexlerae TaxID=418240 RepID=UPI00156D802C|nr:aminopeptidase [Blautia wexlerae]NSK17423.1 aminopeptidase [Blautia wexlerae]